MPLLFLTKCNFFCHKHVLNSFGCATFSNQDTWGRVSENNGAIAMEQIRVLEHTNKARSECAMHAKPHTPSLHLLTYQVALVRRDHDVGPTKVDVLILVLAVREGEGRNVSGCYLGPVVVETHGRVLELDTPSGIRVCEVCKQSEVETQEASRVERDCV